MSRVKRRKMILSSSVVKRARAAKRSDEKDENTPSPKLAVQAPAPSLHDIDVKNGAVQGHKPISPQGRREDARECIANLCRSFLDIIQGTIDSFRKDTIEALPRTPCRRLAPQQQPPSTVSQKKRARHSRGSKPSFSSSAQHVPPPPTFALGSSSCVPKTKRTSKCPSLPSEKDSDLGVLTQNETMVVDGKNTEQKEEKSLVDRQTTSAELDNCGPSATAIEERPALQAPRESSVSSAGRQSGAGLSEPTEKLSFSKTKSTNRVLPPPPSFPSVKVPLTTISSAASPPPNKSNKSSMNPKDGSLANPINSTSSNSSFTKSDLNSSQERVMNMLSSGSEKLLKAMSALRPIGGEKENAQAREDEGPMKRQENTEENCNRGEKHGRSEDRRGNEKFFADDLLFSPIAKKKSEEGTLLSEEESFETALYGQRMIKNESSGAEKGEENEKLAIEDCSEPAIQAAEAGKKAASHREESVFALHLSAKTPPRRPMDKLASLASPDVKLSPAASRVAKGTRPFIPSGSTPKSFNKMSSAYRGSAKGPTLIPAPSKGSAASNLSRASTCGAAANNAPGASAISGSSAFTGSGPTSTVSGSSIFLSTKDKLDRLASHVDRPGNSATQTIMNIKNKVAQLFSSSKTVRSTASGSSNSPSADQRAASTPLDKRIEKLTPSVSSQKKPMKCTPSASSTTKKNIIRPAPSSGNIKATPLNKNANVQQTPAKTPIRTSLPPVDSEHVENHPGKSNKKKPAKPQWTLTPILSKALKMQSAINPDDIFGAVKPIQMEEIFVNRKTRPRTSSAHWDGADSLASSEVAQYNHSMGYHQTLPPSSRSNNSADGR